MRTLAPLPLLVLTLAFSGCPSQKTAEQRSASPADNATSATPASTSTYKVEFETTKGTIVLEVNREAAPRGADRFRELVETGYFEGCTFFRVIDGFVVQFGISGDPAQTQSWMEKKIQDDPVVGTNSRGTLTFATAGPGTRTSQLFFNLVDNPRLDGMGFSPFARVVSGLDVVDSLYSGYGEGAPRGRGPDQQRMTSEGDAYLKANFPKLDRITKAQVLP